MPGSHRTPTWVLAGILVLATACRSDDGVRENTDNGHGFELSQADYELF